MLLKSIGFYFRTKKIRIKLEKNRDLDNVKKQKYRWSKLILKMFKVKFDSKENIKYAEGFKLEDNLLIISNHRSFLDILILEQSLQTLNKKNTTFIAKKELKTTPLIGKVIELMNVLFIDRNNPRDFINLLKKIKERLKEQPKGNLFVIFPEGTRNKEQTKFGNFKEGYLKIAEKNKLNILPVYIKGNPEKYLEQYDGSKPKIEVFIGNIINVKDKKAEDIEKEYKEQLKENDF